MATIRAILDTRSVKKDGTYPLKLSLSHRTKTAYISLDIFIKADQWDGREIISHPKAKSLNQVLRTKISQAENIIKNLPVKATMYTIDDIKHFVDANSTEPPKQREYLLTDHFKKYIFQTKNPRTKQIYQETLTKILKFSPYVTFELANLSWLKSFDTYLFSTCQTNTRAIHMRNIRAVFNDAIDEEITEQNLYPFRKFKIKKERTIKRSLTIAQIKQFRHYSVEKHQEKYRDLFMLIFYLIGINIVDLLRLRHEDFQNGRIEYRRAKTGRLYSIEVLPEAMVIIEKYKGKSYLIDVMDTYTSYKDFAARMNENIQEIGLLEWVKNKAKDEKLIKKNKKKITPLFPDITTYWARHSWATVAAGLDIPKETIAAALGHGGNDTTSTYINFDLKKVDKANRDVLAAIR